MFNLKYSFGIAIAIASYVSEVVMFLQVESSSVVFFEPSSPYFLNTMIISIVLLILAVLCGLFYHSVCYKRLCREPGNQGMLNLLSRWVRV